MRSVKLIINVRCWNLLYIFFHTDGLVTARGCSTKDKKYHIECENHVMGTSSEKFCYCSYWLCNAASLRAADWFAPTIALATILLHLLL